MIGSYGIASLLGYAPKVPPPPDHGLVYRVETYPLPPEAVCIPTLELTDRHCRFPIGAEVGIFCGAPKVRGRFCSFHAGIAYKPKSVFKSPPLDIGDSDAIPERTGPSAD